MAAVARFGAGGRSLGLGALFVCAALFAACGGDDDDDHPPPPRGGAGGQAGHGGRSGSGHGGEGGAAGLAGEGGFVGEGGFGGEAGFAGTGEGTGGSGATGGVGGKGGGGGKGGKGSGGTTSVGGTGATGGQGGTGATGGSIAVGGEGGSFASGGEGAAGGTISSGGEAGAGQGGEGASGGSLAAGGESGAGAVGGVGGFGATGAVGGFGGEGGISSEGGVAGEGGESGAGNANGVGGTTGGVGGTAGDATGGVSGATGGVGGTTGGFAGASGGFAGASGGVAGSSGGSAGTSGAAGAGGTGGGGGWTGGCVKVALDGDDAAALGSNGALAFASVQAAVDFADRFGPGVSVCVASGAACGASGSFTYGGAGQDLAMRDGISVYGRYESTTWTQCADSTTTLLASAAGAGIVFGPEIASDTVLDGFTIQGGNATSGATVTLNGARGVVLSNDWVQVSGDTGVAVLDGGVLEALASDIRGHVTGLVARDSEVLLDGSKVSSYDATPSATGLLALRAAVTVTNGSVSGGVEGIHLEDSPGAVVTGARIDFGSGSGALFPPDAVGLFITGDATGTDLASLQITHQEAYYGVIAGVRARAATGAFAIRDSTVYAANPVGMSYGMDLGVTDPVLIEGSSVSSGGHGFGTNVGLACAGPCTIAGNTIQAWQFDPGVNGTRGTSTALTCSGCSEISDNLIDGQPDAGTRLAANSSTGAQIDGPTLVARNQIYGGCSADSVGLRVGQARVENNIVGCWNRRPGTLLSTSLSHSCFAAIASSGDVDSNLFTAPLANGTGLAIDGTVLVRNNILSGSLYSLQAGTFGALANNDLSGPVLAGSTTFTTDAQVNALANASSNFFANCYPGSTIGNKLPAGSPCIDAGAVAGAPADDFERQPRNDGAPDVGPDEYDSATGGTGGAGAAGGIGGTTGGTGGAGGMGGTAGTGGTSAGSSGTTGGSAGTTGGSAGTTGGSAGTTGGTGSVDACLGVACSGHGTCSSSTGSASCICDNGYGQPLGDTTACADVDECLVGNGGCDSLTACVNLPGAFMCGACPAGYDANGTGGCVPHLCSGAPDASCACIKVAPDGSDTLGVLSNGTTPFQTIQAAIDFADQHRNHTKAVCVAQSAACNLNGGYSASADLTMRDGISLYANYESTTWTRCTSAPGGIWLTFAGANGVLFGSDITSDTVLDGFQVRPPGVTLNGARGVKLRNLRLETSGTSLTDPAGVRAQGNLDGLEITNSSLDIQGSGSVRGIAIASCSGAAVISGNDVHVTNLVAGGSAVALNVSGTCAALIESNSVVSTGGDAVANFALSCAAPCTVRKNPEILVTKLGDLGALNHPPPNRGSVTVLGCSGCSEVSDNTVSSSLPESGFFNVRAGYSATGAYIRDTALVARNDIRSGCADNGIGMDAAGARLENNSIEGGCIVPFASFTGTFRGVGLNAGANLDVHSNRIVTMAPGCPQCQSDGVVLAGAPTVFRNNIVGGQRSALFDPVTVFGDPIVDNGGELTLRAGLTLESNDLLEPLFRSTPSYTTRADYRDLLASFGNFFDSCNTTSDHHLIKGSACIDRGTTTGAPTNDRDGEPRDSHPDVGPDEYSAAHDPCAGITCNHGHCGLANGDAPYCYCDAGYYNPSGEKLTCIADIDECLTNNGGCDPLVTCTNTVGTLILCGSCPSGYTGNGYQGCIPDPCPAGYTRTGGTDCVDIDECLTDNGGCDPLVTCTNTDGGRSCGACPTGYSGDGTTGCVSPCTGFACYNSGTCTVNGGIPSCQCLKGTYGTRCEDVTSMLTGGSYQMTDLGTDGVLREWGMGSNGQSPPNDTPAGTFVWIDGYGPNTCAVQSDHLAVCWGWNAPTAPNDQIFRFVAASNFFACGLHVDGTVACWGVDDQQGNVPPSGATFSSIVAGDHHVCGIKTSDHTVQCWGATDDDYGQTRPPPDAFDAIDSFQFTTCGIRSVDYELACWGADITGGAPLPAGPFMGLAMANDTGCAVRYDGSIACWGSNSYGQASPPAGVFDKVALTTASGCARSTSGGVECWGTNLYGLLDVP